MLAEYGTKEMGDSMKECIKYYNVNIKADKENWERRLASPDREEREKLKQEMLDLDSHRRRWLYFYKKLVLLQRTNLLGPTFGALSERKADLPVY